MEALAAEPAVMDSRIRVVVADDVPDLRLLLRISLEADGRFVVAGEAGDGLEAVRIVGETLPDAVLLDLAMPRMDGFDATSEILRRSPATKVLVLSAFDGADMASSALARGACGYVEKGTDLAEVAERLALACCEGRSGPLAAS
jgi:DNA-binding NarL/FixJ family response regulator